jgi:hypothetical protein
MHAWNRVDGDITELVDAFFTNDPYYPRPNTSDPLYIEFKTGYLETCTTNSVNLAHSFLFAIEAEQLRRNLCLTQI